VSETLSDGGDAAPGRIEEADSQRYLEHQDPEEERDRAGLDDEGGDRVEPLPDERSDES
jgi:hypothetical protein